MKNHYHTLRRRVGALASAAVMLCMLAGAGTATTGCGRSGPTEIGDTMRVATVYGPASYFMYRDTVMGYDYDMVEEMAREKHFVVEWQVAGSIAEAVEWLDGGRVQLVAASVPVDGEFKGRVVYCGPENVSDEVLIQPPGDTLIVDVQQLVGRHVYVEKGSEYEERINEVNEALGGGINIHPIDNDTIGSDELARLVAQDSIPLAVIGSESAKVNKTYYPDMQIAIPLGVPQESRWAVAKRDKWLADTIDSWLDLEKTRGDMTEILRRYLEASKLRSQNAGKFDLEFNNGYASPFDHLYKKHATPAGWDWRLLAAQGWTESRFDSTARSWAGAQGVMQIMPNTAKQFGLARHEMGSAERSIETAVKILNAYDDIMAKKVSDPEERKKFVMAAYNAGPGHVLDAINLAKKYGLNPQKWSGNVEKAMLMKMKRKYYKDPVVKYGYSRGRETVDYVNRIWAYYDRVKKKITQ